MTVKGYNVGMGGQLECQWFAGSTLKSGLFLDDQVIPVVKDEKS